MPYMTSVEQIGYDRGKEERKGEETRSLISLQLGQKLGELSDRTADRINHLSPDRLQALAIALLRFESIDDLTAWLENHG
jgi:hypothetical protein